MDFYFHKDGIGTVHAHAFISLCAGTITTATGAWQPFWSLYILRSNSSCPPVSMIA